MNDEDIGKICQICKKRDYVPFKCKNCQRILCDEDYRSHQCRIVYNPPRKSIGEGKKKQQQFCKVCKKKLFTVNHYFCQKCESLLCLAHRYPETHNCSSQKEDCLCSIM